MLLVQERLRLTSVFQRAYANRQSVSSPMATLYVLQKGKPRGRVGEAAVGPAIGPVATSWLPLVGFVVAKKVCKSACKRNRAKRRVREVYRTLSKRLKAERQQPFAPGERRLTEVLRLDQWYALVLVLHEPVLTASFDEIEAMVLDLLKRANARFGIAKKTSASQRSSEKQARIRPDAVTDPARSGEKER